MIFKSRTTEPRPVVLETESAPGGFRVRPSIGVALEQDDQDGHDQDAQVEGQ